MTFEFVIPQVNAKDPAAAVALLMNDEEFAAFYQRTARPVWAYLARVSGNAALADDLLQESYLRFLGAARWSDGEDACRRYLFKIATNLMRDHWRRAQPTALDDLPEGAWAAADSSDTRRVESQAILGPALARMKPRERQLLWLAY